MADAKLTALTAASALAAADLFYVSQSAASRKATGTQLLALVGTAYVPLAGGTMTGALTLPAGAVGAPSLMFTGAGATTGIYSAGSNDLSFAVNGSKRGVFNVDGFTATGGLQTSNTDGFLRFGLSGTDIFLVRASATRLQVRTQGSTAVALETYSLFTDSSNYERLTITGVAGSSVNITAETLGTGADNLDIILTPAGTGKVGIGAAPSWKLSVVSTTTACDMAVKDSVGALILTTASGAAYLSTNTANPLIFRTNSAEQMRIGSNGVISFGDVTSSYPALKRSTTTLQVRLGDDSGFGDLSARNLVTAPVAFASLTAAATAGNGARAMITNCSHATFGTAADGGGSTKVPVYSDGSSWLVG